ncbi:MAG TPA: DUF177 domain-containing protein [Solirubrobacteraceae bacterium]|nr:DUF177 domain-containing protein [Solirubrobacteraceae bacterium]
MPRTQTLDLASLRLASGEGRRFELDVDVEPLLLGGERYGCDPQPVPVRLEVSRMVGSGYALRLTFRAALTGPCMRCLQDASPAVGVDVREVAVPGGGEELSSPYVQHDTLDLQAWTHDALALAAPVQVLCRPDCAGLCPVCAADLNEAGPGHHHESPPDPRWAKLRELRLD